MSTRRHRRKSELGSLQESSILARLAPQRKYFSIPAAVDELLQCNYEDFAKIPRDHSLLIFHVHRLRCNLEAVLTFIQFVCSIVLRTFLGRLAPFEDETN